MLARSHPHGLVVATALSCAVAPLALAGGPSSDTRTPPPAAALRTYLGNLHSHTSYRDDSGTPSEAYDHARSAGLDFLAITEHSHKSAEGTGAHDPATVPVRIARTPALYEDPRADALIPTAASNTVAGSSVALYGQVYSTVPTQPRLVVHIDSIAPNPVGEETQLDHAGIHNTGTAAVSMVGRNLRNKSGSAWSLDALGTLAPDGAATIVRHGQPMSMKNRGDERIELLSPTAGVMDEIRYSGTAEGQAIL